MSIFICEGTSPLRIAGGIEGEMAHKSLRTSAEDISAGNISLARLESVQLLIWRPQINIDPFLSVFEICHVKMLREFIMAFVQYFFILATQIFNTCYGILSNFN